MLFPGCFTMEDKDVTRKKLLTADLGSQHLIYLLSGCMIHDCAPRVPVDGDMCTFVRSLT